MFSRLCLCFALIGVMFGCGEDEPAPTMTEEVMTEEGNGDCRKASNECARGFEGRRHTQFLTYQSWSTHGSAHIS